MSAAPGAFPDAGLVATFALGALVMRGAGCTINDMWDKKIDKAVERTRDRPIAAGQVLRKTLGKAIQEEKHHDLPFVMVKILGDLKQL